MGKRACMIMTPEKVDNYHKYNRTLIDRYTDVTETTFECSEFGFYDWNETCRIEYWHEPCDMHRNNCTIFYYDYNGTWHADNCTNNLSSPIEWHGEIKHS